MGRLGRLGLAPRSLLQIHRHFSSPLAADLRPNPRNIHRVFHSLLPSLSRAPNVDGKPPEFSTSTFNLAKQQFHASASCYARERDLYEILGIPKDASQDDIKKAFHALAKKYHPDANKNNPAAKRKFQEIRGAYETLRDPATRARSDGDHSKGAEQEDYGANDPRGFRFVHEDPFSDSFHRIFSEIFEDETDTTADIQVDLSLSFFEAARGCTQHLSFDADVPCDSCNGSGFPTNAKPKVCPVCKGNGKVTVPPFISTCSVCKGLGRIIKDTCLVCKGHGVVKGVKEVTVTIPAGVDYGDTIRVPKGGNSGRRGGHPGNLTIKLRVAKDPVFVRDGVDIYVDSHISFTRAMLGGSVEVPTLAGKAQIKIPTGVQPGQLLVLKGKGLPGPTGFFDHGDQYVRFRIHFPSSVTERQRAILEEFVKDELLHESSTSTKEKWWQQVYDELMGLRFVIHMALLTLILLLLSRGIG